MTNTLCPVCGYDLGFPAWVDDSSSLEICPCCGIQFGYSDFAGGDCDRRKEIHIQWRERWIKAGMPWSSVGQKPPLSWNPKEQVKNPKEQVKNPKEQVKKLCGPLVRARRILTPMERFKAAFKDGLPAFTPIDLVVVGEEIVGLYENVLDTATECIVITDRRLLVEKHGEWESIDFRHIASIVSPDPASIHTSETTLLIRLLNGESRLVPIRGRHGRFFDLYEFSRFLMRVRDDVNEELRKGAREERG